MSGVPVEPVYGPADGERPGPVPVHARAVRRRCTARSSGRCGCSPASAPRSTRTAASTSCSPPAATASRPRSTCPTLMGRDSDDELALGEVGKCGVAVDTLADVEDLYRGIDLGAVTTSMTINGPAAVIFAMFVANAEATGVERARARRHAAERHPEGVPGAEGVHLPAPPVAAAGRATRCAFCTAEMPRWHPISISGYHIREAGSTAAQELAFTVANGFAYVELGLAGRARRRRVRAAPLVLLQRAHRLLRGDREVPRRPPDLGALDARPLRRPSRAVAADAVPHADRGRVAHRAAARGQHRAHRDRGARRRARRHAEPAHELDGRDARAADREGGAHRAAHPAGDRARDARRRTSPTRSAARGTSRRSPTRWSARPRRSSPTSRSSATARCSTARSRRRGGLVPGRDRRRRVRARAEAERRPPRRRRRQRLPRGQRRAAAADRCGSAPRSKRSSAAGSTRCGRPRRRRGRTRARARAQPTPPTPRST